RAPGLPASGRSDDAPRELDPVRPGRRLCGWRVDDDAQDGCGPVRARFAIDERAIRREMERVAEQGAARAASISQMRVKEGIALTDRVGTGKMLNQIGVRRT